jgi:hypothetical protein
MLEGIPEEALPTIDLREHEALINRKRNLQWEGFFFVI